MNSSHSEAFFRVGYRNHSNLCVNNLLEVELEQKFHIHIVTHVRKSDWRESLYLIALIHTSWFTSKLNFSLPNGVLKSFSGNFPSIVDFKSRNSLALPFCCCCSAILFFEKLGPSRSVKTIVVSQDSGPSGQTAFTAAQTHCRSLSCPGSHSHVAVFHGIHCKSEYCSYQCSVLPWTQRYFFLSFLHTKVLLGVMCVYL